MQSRETMRLLHTWKMEIHASRRRENMYSIMDNTIPAKLPAYGVMSFKFFSRYYAYLGDK